MIEGIETNLFKDENNLLEYRSFIQFCNGARFGDIDLWGVEEILENQFYIKEHIDVLVCIGQILYEPIIVNKANGNIYLFDYDNNTIRYDIEFGSFNNFINEFIFGVGYEEIIPDIQSDEWYNFLKKIGVI